METYSVNSSFDNFLAYLDFFIIIILTDLIYYLYSKVWIRKKLMKVSLGENVVWEWHIEWTEVCASVKT